LPEHEQPMTKPRALITRRAMPMLDLKIQLKFFNNL
jgi:hypothetical protein